jgi:glutamate/aspartate transport system substrate-binding protein
MAVLSAMLLVAAPTLALPAKPAGAQELAGRLKKIQETGRIVIGYRDASIPFSYVDAQQQPMGYALDICARIVDAVKSELRLPRLEVTYVSVTPLSRIALMVDGTIDLECGSTTNNPERQRRVWFTNTHFLSVTRYATKVAAKITTVGALKRKSVAVTAGTTTIKQVTDNNEKRNLQLTIVPTKDHAEGFAMLEADRVVAVFNDDVILASLIAASTSPERYVMSQEGTALPEPYGIMLPRNDFAFKRVVDAATMRLYTSTEFPGLYAKWFQEPIPAKGINLNMPMSPAMNKMFASPTDTPNAMAY